MNLLRNILTAIWCALIAGFYGFLVRTLFEATPHPSMVAVGLFGASAIFALLALVYAPLLMLSVIAQIGLAGIVFVGVGSGFGAFAGYYLALMTAVTIVSAGFVYWDIRYRRTEKMRAEMPSAEVFG